MSTPINPPLEVPSKSFDLWFYTDFSVTSITPTSGDLRFRKIPMNSTTGETYPSGDAVISCDVWEAARNIPEAAAAMQAVIAALPLIENWKNS